MNKFTITGLCVDYGETRGLNDVSMEIQSNRITALIGPSGCGKTTFLRSLNRMNDRLDDVRISGTVLYDGFNVYREYNVIELRKRIGLVFQKPNPFPRSIFDNIAFGLRLHGINNRTEVADRVESCLKEVHLFDEVATRLSDSALMLSGGQQQRLCIARALAVRPDVLLMDEPTSALDPIATERIEELAVELKEHYTIVIVTHNMMQAARIADRTAFFLSGRLVEEDETPNLFFNSQNEETKEYISGHYG